MSSWLLLEVKSNYLGGGGFGEIRIGFGKVGCFDKKYQRTLLDNKGLLRFNGPAFIGNGSRIVVANGAVIEFGSNFENTSSITIICFKKIVFGKNVLTSWDILIMDTDFHFIYDKNDARDSLSCEKEVIIGDNVWVGCRCTILKGVIVCDNSVVAACSVVNKPVTEKSVLLAGNPAVIKKRGILWNRKLLF